MEIEYNGASWFIVGLIGLLIWVYYFFPILKIKELFLPSTARKGFRVYLRSIACLIGIVGWSYVSYSLTLPRIPLGKSESRIEVNDIFMVMDCSRSMLADDFRPNRFEVAKKKIIEFVEMRPKDRIGIITFAEKIFTVLPLTTDIELVKRVVPDINMGILGNGTNIGDALGLAVARLTLSPTKNKIVILLTDGVSNVGNLTPLQAAEEAKAQNIRIYTIGIGTDQNARIPSYRPGQFQNIPGGSIDIETLTEISNMTGAKFYYAKDDSSLAEVLADINNLERTEIRKSGIVLYKELYYKYLMIGFILLLISEISRRALIRDPV
ncbi:MAG: VWA domain-containing protein [Bdellovibrio sp.]|nr:VWA domain-containing protein [Bdellovibrio sp.]